MRVERVAEEKAKKKVAVKRQEEVELKKKLEEEARLKKIQQAVRYSSLFVKVECGCVSNFVWEVTFKK